MDSLKTIAEYFKGDNVHNIQCVKKVLLDNGFFIKTKESKNIVKITLYEDKYSMKHKEPFTSSSSESEEECWETVFQNLLRYFKTNY